MPSEGAGDYEIGWRVRGVALGAPLIYHAPAPAASLSPCRAWLGKPQIGGSLAGLPSDLKAVNRYSLPTAAAGAGLQVYLAPNGAPGDQRLRGVVYADAGGAPGALVGVTEELDFPSSASAGWYVPAVRKPAGPRVRRLLARSHLWPAAERRGVCLRPGYWRRAPPTRIRTRPVLPIRSGRS